MMEKMAQVVLGSIAAFFIIGVLIPLIIVAKTVMLIADGLGCIDD